MYFKYLSKISFVAHSLTSNLRIIFNVLHHIITENVNTESNKEYL